MGDGEGRAGGIYSFLTCDGESGCLRDATTDAPLGLMIIFAVFKAL